MDWWTILGRSDNVIGILARSLRLRELGHSLNHNAGLLANPVLEQRMLDDARADLLLLSSELQAALRILIPEENREARLDGVELVADGYWTDLFASRTLLSAKRRIIVVTWRNSRVLGVELIERLLHRMTAHGNLQVDIYALSSEASDEVCENLSRMVTLASAADICREQLHHRDLAASVISRQLAAGTIPANVLGRLHYHEYKIMPFLHCVIVDDDMDPTSGASDTLARAFIHAPARSDFGKKILEQVQVVRELSTEVDLRTRTA